MSVYTKIFLIAMSLFAFIAIGYVGFMAFMDWHASQLNDRRILSEFAFTCKYQVGTTDKKVFNDCIQYYLHH